jgi:hypothetical protein
MYFGHFAIGAALKAKGPDVPVLPIMIGVGLIDIIDGLFIMAGIDTVTPNLKALPYLFFDLKFIDWDHSLLMALIWSLLFGLIFWKNRKVAIFATIAAFSHFIVDIPMHNGDLALFPFSSAKIGMGIWGKYPYGSWFFEVAFSLLLLAYSWYKSHKQKINILPQIIFLCLLMIQMSPWFSPMKNVAKLSEPYTHLLHGFLVSCGFLIPSLIFVYLYKRSSFHSV